VAPSSVAPSATRPAIAARAVRQRATRSRQVVHSTTERDGLDGGGGDVPDDGLGHDDGADYGPDGHADEVMELPAERAHLEGGSAGANGAARAQSQAWADSPAGWTAAECPKATPSRRALQAGERPSDCAATETSVQSRVVQRGTQVRLTHRDQRALLNGHGSFFILGVVSYPFVVHWIASTSSLPDFVGRHIVNADIGNWTGRVIAGSLVQSLIFLSCTVIAVSHCLEGFGRRQGLQGKSILALAAVLQALCGGFVLKEIIVLIGGSFSRSVGKQPRTEQGYRHVVVGWLLNAVLLMLAASGLLRGGFAQERTPRTLQSASPTRPCWLPTARLKRAAWPSRASQARPQAEAAVPAKGSKR